MKYKAEDFCSGTLRPLREAAGLGSPPSSYYTNPNESINSALKKKTDYKKQELPVFINSMKEFVSQQQEEVEKAIIGGGKYSIDTPSKAYEVVDGSWFRPMSQAQRKAHVKKFNSLKLTLCDASNAPAADIDNSLLPSNSSSSTVSYSLSVSLNAAMQELA